MAYVMNTSYTQGPNPGGSGINISGSDILTGAGLVGQIGGLYLDWKQGEDNLAMAKSNLDYMKALQKQIFQREDTAIQRRVADMRAAGINPVLAAGNAANAGQVVKTEAPQRTNTVPARAAQLALHMATLMQAKSNIGKTNAERDLTKLKQLSEIQGMATARSQEELNKQLGKKAKADAGASWWRSRKDKHDVKKYKQRDIPTTADPMTKSFSEGKVQVGKVLNWLQEKYKKENKIWNKRYR